MINRKINFKGILCDIYYPEERYEGSLIIFCPGLPGSWKYEKFANYFSSNGFIFLHPKYYGSWESTGKFSISECKKTIEILIDLDKNKIKDIYGKTINLKINKVYLMGHSFGGSLSLALGAERFLAGIISLSPIIDFESHNDSGNESDLKSTFEYICLGSPGLFRGISKEDWNLLCKNKHNISPSQHIEKLSSKKILFVHGKKDLSVDYKKTINFYNNLKNKNASTNIYLHPSAGHSDIRELSMHKILEWLNSN